MRVVSGCKVAEDLRIRTSLGPDKTARTNLMDEAALLGGLLTITRTFAEKQFRPVWWCSAEGLVF